MVMGLLGKRGGWWLNSRLAIFRAAPLLCWCCRAMAVDSVDSPLCPGSFRFVFCAFAVCLFNPAALHYIDDIFDESYNQNAPLHACVLALCLPKMSKIICFIFKEFFSYFSPCQFFTQCRYT